MTDESLSPVAEEYLEAIYKLLDEGRPAIGARLAERLHVSAPTVAGTLQRLSRDGLITMSEDRSVQLTNKGKQQAETLVRRHRLAERLLTDILHLDWHLAHVEACNFEHAISPEVEERLSEVLGHPHRCPHGRPIPGNADPEELAASVNLDDLQPGQEAVVEWVPEEGPELTVSEDRSVQLTDKEKQQTEPLLAYLDRNGIRPGARLKVTEVGPVQGPVTVELNGRSLSLSLDLASRIRVTPTQG